MLRWLRRSGKGRERGHSAAHPKVPTQRPPNGKRIGKPENLKIKKFPSKKFKIYQVEEIKNQMNKEKSLN